LKKQCHRSCTKSTTKLCHVLEAGELVDGKERKGRKEVKGGKEGKERKK
jgi:hypothetical protein